MWIVYDRHFGSRPSPIRCKAQERARCARTCSARRLARLSPWHRSTQQEVQKCAATRPTARRSQTSSSAESGETRVQPGDPHRASRRRSRAAGDRIRQARHDRPDCRPTARATPSSTTWSSGVSSLTSPPATSARAASSTSRVGSRAASGRPPTAALDAPSRSSPTGSRRSPPRALRRLRRHDRRGSSPRGFSPGPLGDGSPIRNVLLGFSASRVARSRTASRRSEPPLRSGSPEDCVLSLDSAASLRVLPRP